MVKHDDHRAGEISWERVRRIFGDPAPVQDVWESQFDRFDKELAALARTPYEQIDFGDLWYYYHDLASMDLQPNLFAYLFPVCLMHWHHTLLHSQEWAGDIEFHSALLRGDILDKMLTAEQTDGMCRFFRDSFLARLDADRSVKNSNLWIFRLNSLGLIIPKVEILWTPWWEFDTAGRTVAGLQYCSGLMYRSNENPLYEPWTPVGGGGGPYLWEHDSEIYDSGWLRENTEFLRQVLTVEFVGDRLALAVSRLEGEPEFDVAVKMHQEFADRRSLIAARVSELPVLLGRSEFVAGWTT